MKWFTEHVNPLIPEDTEMNEYDENSPNKTNMSGPEHYREAERLIQVATAFSEKGQARLRAFEHYASDADMLAAAQVHATLAQTSATVLAATVAADDGSEYDSSDYGGLIGEHWISIL